MPDDSQSRGDEFDVLIVSNSKADRDWICNCTGATTEWRCQWVRTASEMLDMIRRGPVPVVVCRRELPDSAWKNVLIATQEFRLPPSVIVLSDAEDIDLWTEVLNQGGFDTVHRGVRRDVVAQTLRQAHRRWKRKQEILSARHKNPASVDATTIAHTA
jgi:DNA-binding NtrC family response regulator